MSNHIPKVLLIGDMMMDHYIFGNCDRISPEAPVQVVSMQSEEYKLGGACNVAKNLAVFGAQVLAVGLVGDDDNAKNLIKMLKDISIDTNGILLQKDRHTIIKSRIISANQQIIRIDKESSHTISKNTQNKIISFVKKNIQNVHVVVLSDYNKGLLNNDLCQEIISIAKNQNIKVLIDPKGKDYSKYKNAYAITPNKKEASIASNIDIVDEGSLQKAGFLLKQKYDIDNVVMTLSEDGISLFNDKMTKIPTHAKEVYDVTGAGDTVIAALAYKISKKHNMQNDTYDMIEACKFANTAAAVVVGKLGSATATKEEIQDYLHSMHIYEYEQKIVNIKNIQMLARSLRANQKSIAFTNGCFDILHMGHISYLKKARQFGDVLILGLNSDKSIKQLKGEHRPITNQNDRAYILSAIEYIDYIVIFDTPTPYEIISAIKPDVLIKGADYKDKEIIGSDVAKKVELIEFQEGKSTTNIIKKIKDGQ